MQQIPKITREAILKTENFQVIERELNRARIQDGFKSLQVRLENSMIQGDYLWVQADLADHPGYAGFNLYQDKTVVATIHSGDYTTDELYAIARMKHTLEQAANREELANRMEIR